MLVPIAKGAIRIDGNLSLGSAVKSDMHLFLIADPGRRA